MKQPISGVSPAQLREAHVMTIWPSLVTYPTGRFLGRLYAIRFPNMGHFRLGNLIALASIPHALLLYFCRIAPFIGTRYTLTNRRVVVRKGLSGAESKAIDLDRFDDIEIEVKSGYEWFNAGDLVFKKDGVETFRLAGVVRPDTFRSTCMHAQRSHVGVSKALAQQPALT